MSNEGAKMPLSDQRKRSTQSSQGSFGSDHQHTVNPAPSELRLVLLGKTGSGKSATGNSILGNKRFDDGLSMSSVTKECKRERAKVNKRELVLVDTPGLFDTGLTDDVLKQEEIRCLALSSPGPHAFLLVVPIEQFTEEQQRTVKMILEMFHEDVTHHTILVFSHADKLRGESIEGFISRQNQKVQKLVERFGRRFVAFDNTDPTNPDQVSRLLQTADEILTQNDNRHFTSRVSEVIQEAQEIIEEKTLAKIKKEVKKLANDQWRSFIVPMNKERQDTERKRKRIRSRIDQIEEDIRKEEQSLRPISARLKGHKVSLKRELDNLSRLLDKEIEEEDERTEKEVKEKKELKIWKKEEEQRRLIEEGQNYKLSEDWVIKLSLFMLGAGAKYAPALLAFLFPEAPAVEAGLAVQYLASLLGLGAPESRSLFGTVAETVKAAYENLPKLTNCCIQ